ncbi:MAG TPA: SDR family oxidoreductase [Prosthecochloris aestuarii]|uniref:SDR family oxidoreductase n=1 Tax=Prosthecochloris aestuarii TaxID=1102 RepID=A0A831WVT2_PROAE|nr:SDR family oxidoreductase [Prosthecochloris aestuarii]
MNPEGITAVVTGASSGIGLDLCRQLAGRCAMVYGLSRRPVPLEHPAVAWVQTDVTDQAQIRSAFRRVLDRHEVVDLLVNNAGFGLFGDVETIDPAGWQRLIATNLTAPFLCTQQVVPGMKARNRGTIVNISSIAGRKGFAGGSAYCASKFGLNGFSEALVEELRGDGIRVCTVCPGSTGTEFFDRAGIQPKKLMNSDDVARMVLSLVELPDDVLPDQVVVRPL